MQAFLILVVAIFGWNSLPAIETAPDNSDGTMTTYYFIRHAEKDTSNPKERNPKLTAQGLERAEKWAKVFDEVHFDAIYSTDFHRTRQTAAPIAKAKNLQVEFYDPAKPNDPSFREKHQGKTVLVVGHSNTNPAFVNALLGEAKYKDIEETQSGSLFIVTVSSTGEANSQLLYIN